jgi:ribosomal protein S18 acetylase RimI-like enzyme
VKKKILRQYLEIKSLKEIKETVKPENSYSVELVEPSDFQLNKFFYKQVGKKYNWIDRLIWTDKNWIDYISNKNLLTFILKQEENLAGYFELILHDSKNEIEIAYFGLLEEYFGKKLGGYLLTEALRLSLNMDDIKRVWCHTCSYDHEHGIKNYLSRGMNIFKTETINL